MGLLRLVTGSVLSLALAAGAVALTAGSAAAGCVEPTTPMLQGTDHDVAFAGSVTTRSEDGDDVITTVRVDRVFAGEVTRRVDVVSSAAGGDYSVDAEVGEQVIVFGRLVDGEVTSSLCTTVRASGPAFEQVSADLGEGTAPAPGYLKAERRTFGLTYEQFRAGRAILGALGLLALGYVGVRAWRARRHTP